MANSIEVKRENMNSVFRTIYENTKISKQEIANILNLSLPTVSQLVSELTAKGLVYDNGFFESTGGRKAKGISCRLDVRTAIGIDITQNHICGVLLDLSGKVLDSKRVRIRFDGSADYYGRLKNLIDEILEVNKIERSTVLGVGVSVPAIVRNNRELVYAPLLQSVDIYSQLSDYISFPYVLINDANAGGFAEAWYSSSHAANMLYLSLSNTVGGAVIMNNKIYYGDQCLGGEIGHTTLVMDGLQCYCGKKGCVDSYCSAEVLARHADGDLRHFFELLEAGDETCVREWRTYLRYLAVVINNLHNCLDCEVTVGGYVGSYMEKYIHDLRKLVLERSTFEVDSNYIKSCVLKFESSAVGAALYYIDGFIKKI